MKYRDKLGLFKIVVAVLGFTALCGYLLASWTAQPMPIEGEGTTRLPVSITPETVSSRIDAELTSQMQRLLSTYENTMRNCYGKLCFDEPVKQSDGKKVDRVGILAIPLSGGEELIQLVRSIIETNPLIHLSLSSNVPCYGYGKNHGFSRVVRIARKVFPHALALVSKVDGVVIDQNLNHSMNSRLLRGQVAQLVRWHCRLSHVAAHTKLLTVFVDDLLLRPVVELEKVLTFIGVKYQRAQLVSVAPAFASTLAKSLSSTVSKYVSAPTTSPDTSSELKVLITDGHDEATEQSVQYTVPTSVLQPMVAAMELELQQSNGLNKWPCASFRDVESPDGPKQQSSTPSLSQSSTKSITQKLFLSSDRLAANCSDPFVLCSVAFDRSGG